MAYDLVGDVEDLMDELSGYGEEIVGDEWDELAGDGDELEEFLGAVPVRRRASAGRVMQGSSRLRQLATAIASAKGGSGKQLQRVSNKQLRRYPLGLGATSLGAGATAIISANPQLPFRVNRLVSPSTGILIDNIAVGTVSQFVAAGSVPVEVFAPNAVGVGLKGDTAVPGVSVQITVSNPTGGALVFSGAIIGEVAQ